MAREAHVPVREFINIGAREGHHSFVCPGCSAQVQLKDVHIGQIVNHPCGKQFDLVWWRGVTDPQELERYLTDAAAAPSTTFDYEATGLDAFVDELVGVSFCRVDEPNLAIYVPMRHKIGQNMDYAVASAIYVPFITSYPMNAHNFEYEGKMTMVKYGKWPKFSADTQIDCWLDDPNRAGRFDPRGVALKDMAEELWDLHVTRLTDLIDLKTMNFSDVDTKRAVPYGCQDSDLGTRLVIRYKDKNQREQPIIRDLEHALIPYVAKMHLRGVKLDVRKLADGATKLDAAIEKLEREVFQLMGFEIAPDPMTGEWMRPFDLGSKAKVAKQFFLVMGLPYDQRNVGKPTKDFPKGQPSVAEDALEDLADEYEVVKKYAEWTGADLMRRNFVGGLPTHVNPKTGFIHGSFNQTGAPTGRFSHSKPNLAQIPKLDD